MPFSAQPITDPRDITAGMAAGRQQQGHQQQRLPLGQLQRISREGLQPNRSLTGLGEIVQQLSDDLGNLPTGVAVDHQEQGRLPSSGGLR
jgi:hypothetical protein